MSRNAFGLHAFGCDITVEADSADLLATLQRYVLPSLPRKSPADEFVLQVHRTGDGFQLQCDGMVSSAHDLRSLAVETVRLIDEGLVKRITGLTAVHAGVVELGGRALLLPGSTKSGKSSLVAELLRHGAVYFSDEYALIDAQGRAHPYPRPLMIRNADQDQSPSLPEEWSAAVGVAPAPVGWILALKYDAGAGWSVTPVPQSEAFLILLRNTPHEVADSPRIVEALRRASASARCYTGSRSEAGAAAEEILRLVSA